MMTYKPSKLGQTDLVFGLWSEFICGLYVQNYKSLSVAVMICVTLVTHTYSLWPVILLAQIHEKRHAKHAISNKAPNKTVQ